MGCVCCSLSSFVSIVLDSLERISLCTVCAMLVCCLLFTLISVMVLGIGIGFHYCFVQHSVDAMAKAAKAAGAVRSGAESGPVMRSVDKAQRRGGFPRVDPSRERREVANPPPANNTYYRISTFNGTNIFRLANNLYNDTYNITRFNEY